MNHYNQLTTQNILYSKIKSDSSEKILKFLNIFILKKNASFLILSSFQLVLVSSRSDSTIIMFPKYHKNNTILALGIKWQSEAKNFHSWF